MKKAAFIIPYYGKFNNYFQLFLDSCSYNKDYDWIIFTDNIEEYDYPSNVSVYKTTFQEICNYIASKFSFPIVIDKPYKLCDYKPAYGFIFQKYLTKYQFWGYCDVDLILGCLNNFISESDFLNYDKIGVLGHLTLIRNTEEVTNAFLKPLNGNLRAKEVYMNRKNCSFDEEFNKSINNIFEQYNYRIRYEEYEANIYTKSSNFKIVRLNPKTKKYEVESKKKSFFEWNKGILQRYVMKNKAVDKEEYMYIHMQSRPMNIKSDLSFIRNMKRYKIIPNSFELFEVDYIDYMNFEKIKKKYFNMHYFRLRTKNLIDKIKKKFEYINIDILG